MPNLDYAGLAGILLSDAARWLVTWCPGGKLQGREYVAGTMKGGPGDSFKCNLETGKWAEFAGDERGGDLISLFACIEGIKMGEAAKYLATAVNYPLSSNSTLKTRTKIDPPVLGIPPEGVIEPPMVHPKWGAPIGTWCYRLPSGLPIFYEARYDSPEGKQYVPWSWDKSAGRWAAKGYPVPRPLYGLETLYRKQGAPIMIVEGPKCAEAAREMAGNVYAVVTWSNGAQAYGKADWAPVYGRDVLIWPDADEPGIKAANEIGQLIGPRCRSVKILNVDGQPDKWDAADALAEGWDWEKFKEWAKPRAALLAFPMQMEQGEPDQEDGPRDSNVAIYEKYGLALTKQGKPYFNIDNAVRIMEREPKFNDFVWLDEFYMRNFTNWGGGPVREWNDIDTMKLTYMMQSEYGLPLLNDKMVYQAMAIFAHNRKRNAPRTWMESLEWDGEPRVDTFFSTYFSAEDNEYTRAVSKNFWVGMVARIFKPGCKMDNMVVLEGKQGSLKSTALDIIGREWYTEANESVTSKDFFMVLTGKLIVEIAELQAFNRAEVTRIKQVVSCRTDRYRAPYERTAQDHPRMSIFVGTTNETAYLRDDTGGRRFWPIKCGQIKTISLREYRDQFFAEAVKMLKDGATWYEMPKDSTALEQDRRRQDDEWETVIGDWLKSQLGTDIKIYELATSCLKIDVSDLDARTQSRIGKILTGKGYERRLIGATTADGYAWGKKE